MIADGKHAARLFDLNFCMTRAGTPAASFVWETVEGNERLSFVLALTDSTGRPNHFGIQLMRRWATGWDGINLDWFRDNKEALLGTTALLTVRDGHVVWATPVDAGQVKVEGQERNLAPCAASPVGGPLGDRPAGQHDENGDHHSSTPNFDSLWRSTAGLKPVEFLPERLAHLPDCEATATGSYSLFLYLTEGSEKISQDVNWLNLVYSVKPRQRDMNEDDWQTVIDRILALAKKETEKSSDGESENAK